MHNGGIFTLGPTEAVTYRSLHFAFNGIRLVRDNPLFSLHCCVTRLPCRYCVGWGWWGAWIIRCIISRVARIMSFYGFVAPFLWAVLIHLSYLSRRNMEMDERDGKTRGAKKGEESMVNGWNVEIFLVSPNIIVYVGLQLNRRVQ